MFSLFLNPYTMIAGAALVSSPIIIHLINRMRFRRVPWAAMEFLLKSQKRNRRRRIIEQLILLLLRILLVLLVGLLLARFISDALAFVQPQSTVHVVVLDDSASMGDAWRVDGERRMTFDVAKKAIVEEIAQGASQARTPQSLDVIRLSELDAPIHIDRINSDSVEELRSTMGDLQPTALHLTSLAGVRKARELFDRSPNSKHVLHVVSDFRHGDWAGSPSEALAQEIGTMAQAKGAAATAVHLLDVADPARSPTQSEIRAHDNIGIIDLQPATKVAARYMPLEFTLTIGNFSPAAQRNVRIIVRVNGQPREESSLTIVDLKPGINQATFTATLDQLGTSQVSAAIEVEDTGLAADNRRFATVEVREKVPILFVEGDLANRAKPESDAFYLRALFLDAAKGFDVVERGVQELEQPSLDQYPCIFVLNVPRLNDKARVNLEAYTRAGGGVFFALGDAVDADFYNQQLYADGHGIFPCPLEPKPTTKLTDVQKVERIFDAAMPPKVFPRGESHPILARLYREEKNRESNTYLRFLLVDQYFPVPRARWNTPPGSVDELLTLPNYRSLDDYKESTQQLLNQIPADDAKYTTYRKALKEHQRRIKDILANGKQLYQLAGAIESLLTDPADPRDAEKTDLRSFWQQPAMTDLSEKFARLMESVRFGDPLLVGKRYGQGPVLALLTTAGSAWTDFPNGPARPYFVMLMLEAEKHLAGAGVDANRLVGTPLELTMDANRYASKIRRFFIPDAIGDTDPKAANAQDLGEQVGAVNGGTVRFLFGDNRKPGVYRFELAVTGDGGRVDQQAVAFNVDTLAEGDLRRASRSDLESAAPGAKLHSPGSGLADLLRERRSDLSESPWLFLALLLALVAEQAMAVRLSYHIDGNAPIAAVQAGARAST
jgi:hypothetical protein